MGRNTLNSFPRTVASGKVITPNPYAKKCHPEIFTKYEEAKSPRAFMDTGDLWVFFYMGKIYFTQTGLDMGLSQIYFMYKGEFHMMKMTKNYVSAFAFAFREAWRLHRYNDHLAARFCRFQDLEFYDRVVIPAITFEALEEDVEYGGDVDLPNIVYENVYNDDEVEPFVEEFNETETALYSHFEKHVKEGLAGPRGRPLKWRCPKYVSDFLSPGDFSSHESPRETLESRDYILPIVSQLPKLNSRKSNGKIRTIISMSRGLHAILWHLYGVINKCDTDDRVIKNLNVVKPRKFFYDINSCDERMLKYVYRYAKSVGHVDILCPFIWNAKIKRFVRVNRFASGLLVTKFFVESFTLALCDLYAPESNVSGDGFMSDTEIDIARVFRETGIPIRLEDTFNGFVHSYGMYWVKPHVPHVGFTWRYTRAADKLRQKRWALPGRVNGLKRRHLLEYIYIFYLNASIDFSAENPYVNMNPSEVFTEIQQDVSLWKKIHGERPYNIASNVIEDYPVELVTIVSQARYAIPRVKLQSVV